MECLCLQTTGHVHSTEEEHARFTDVACRADVDTDTRG